MSRRRYVEPSIPVDYDGSWRVCSCGCGEKRPLTLDFFSRLTVVSKYGTWRGFQYCRKVCRNAKIRKARGRKK